MALSMIGPRQPEQAASDGELAAPAGYGWRRVMLVVAVPEEAQALLRAALPPTLWSIGPPGDRSSTRDSFVRVRVEAWVNGAKLGAHTHARKQFIARTAHIAGIKVLGVGRAPSSVVDQFAVWHMYREPAWGRNALTRWLRRWWIEAGCADEGGTVYLAATAERPDAERAFQRNDHGGVPFETGTHGARRAIGPAPSVSDEGVRTGPGGRHGRETVALVLLMTLVLGGVGHLVPWPWRLVLGLPLAVAARTLGSWITSNAERPWAIRFGIGTLLSAAFASTGYVAAGVLMTTPGGALWHIGVIVGAWLAVLGSWHACRASRMTRHFLTLLPVLVLPLPWVIPFLAQFLQSEYLNQIFGIPVASVNIDPIMTYATAIEPAFFVACTAVCCLGLVGWTRYFYLLYEAKVMTILLVSLVALSALALITLSAVSGANTAARQAAASAAAGRDPTPYFGIDGQLVCVRAVVPQPAVENGPLPTSHPLLVFDRTGDDLWMWDPDRATARNPYPSALRVKAEHVTTWKPRADPRPCRPTAPSGHHR